MDISQHSFQWGSGTISELSTGLVSHVDCACELITWNLGDIYLQESTKKTSEFHLSPQSVQGLKYKSVPLYLRPNLHVLHIPYVSWVSTSISTGENPLPTLSYVFNLCLFTLSFLIKNKKRTPTSSSPSSSLFHNQTSQNDAHPHHTHGFLSCTTLHLLCCGSSKKRSSLELSNVAKPQCQF